MSVYSDMNDPAAVRKAMAEFDRIGRDAFLTKYKLGGAHGWLLIKGKREYDAKAILGVAYGYQFPERGHLTSGDFHGGEPTARCLRRMGFTVIEPSGSPALAPKLTSSRNPPWTRDELILALDLYMRHRPSLLDDRHQAVIELSDLLGRLATLEGRASASGLFRNPNGVGMKLANFARLDPAAKQGRRGLSNGGAGEQEVWDDFAPNQSKLRETADAIRAVITAGAMPQADDEEEDGQAEALEGRVMTRQHQVRERNGKIVRKRKDQAMQRGSLACEACRFDFAERYGRHGHGFIECHHTRPVSTLRPGEVTRLKDLALLCANCHRMIHARRPWLSLDELRALLTA